MEQGNAIQPKVFNTYINAISVEIEQAQVRTVVAANSQMLLHYWRVGHYIVFCQNQLGWGGKVIEKTSKTIGMLYPHKKGYSPRNLKYMCQFAKLYSFNVLQRLSSISYSKASLDDIIKITRGLNNFGQEVPAQIQMTDDSMIHLIGQEPLAQIQTIENVLSGIMQLPIVQIENLFLSSAVSYINWASHIKLMDAKIPLGTRYWYMKETLEYGWSSNVLDIQIKTDLFGRQMKEKKVNKQQ